MATLGGLAARLRMMGDVRKAISDNRERIAEAAVADTQYRMAMGLQPDGTPQPPIKEPRRSGNSGPPLVDYGDLSRSVSADVSGTVLTIRAVGPGASKHQATRPFLGMSPALAREIGDIIAESIAASLAPSGV